MQLPASWRPALYWSCAAVCTAVALRNAIAILASLLFGDTTTPPGLGLPQFVLRAGELVPPEATAWLSWGMPVIVFSVVGMVQFVLMLMLMAAVVRRAWLTLVRRERTPAAFAGKLQLLAVCGLGTLAFLLAASMVRPELLTQPTGIPLAACVAWAFFLTECRSFLARWRGEPEVAPPTESSTPGVRSRASSGPMVRFGQVVLSMFLRSLVAIVLIVVAIAAAILSGLPYGGGSQGLFFLAAFAFFFGVGWALLPAWRASRIVAVGLTALWFAAGIGATGFSSGAGGGWLAAPWLLATGVLLVALARRPDAVS